MDETFRSFLNDYKENIDVFNKSSDYQKKEFISKTMTNLEKIIKENNLIYKQDKIEEIIKEVFCKIDKDIFKIINSSFESQTMILKQSDEIDQDILNEFSKVEFTEDLSDINCCKKSKDEADDVGIIVKRIMTHLNFFNQDNINFLKNSFSISRNVKEEVNKEYSLLNKSVNEDGLNNFIKNEDRILKEYYTASLIEKKEDLKKDNSNKNTYQII